jgi:hypothetical protein
MSQRCTMGRVMPHDHAAYPGTAMRLIVPDVL